MSSFRNILTAVLGGLAVCSQVFANSVVLSDNFDSENGGNGAANFNSFANWTVSNGTVDLIGNGFHDFYPSNGLYVDLDGSSYQAGVFQTTLSFSAGIYELAFEISGSQRGDTNVVLIQFGDYSKQLILNSDFPLTPFVLKIHTTGGHLSFQNQGADNNGAILDNITLTPVPEPSSIALCAIGFSGLGILARKQGRQPSVH
jgi:hypothetical protein